MKLDRNGCEFEGLAYAEIWNANLNVRSSAMGDGIGDEAEELIDLVAGKDVEKGRPKSRLGDLYLRCHHV